MKFMGASPAGRGDGGEGNKMRQESRKAWCGGREGLGHRAGEEGRGEGGVGKGSLGGPFLFFGCQRWPPTFTR